jgi:two-component system, sensor histidine kinase and response regulator
VKNKLAAAIGCICCCLVLSGVLNAQQYRTDSLLQIVENGSDNDKLSALQFLAQSVRNSNPQQAILYIQQAIDKAKSLGNEDELAKALQILASLEYRRGNFTAAKDNYQEALNHFSDANNNKVVADILSALGGIHFSQGNLPMASDCYLRALRIYEGLADKVGMMSVYGSLGNVYARQNNFSKSIEYNLKALSLYEESSDKFRTLIGYENIGNIYFRQKNPDRARYYFSKALVIYSDIQNKTGVATTLFQLGNIEQISEQHNKAIDLYKRSIVICEALKMQPLLVSNLNAMAASYAQLRLYNKAIPIYQQVIKLAKSIDSKIELEEAYQGLAQIYQTTQEKEKATTFNALSKELKDSLYNDSNLKKLTDQQLVYESEKKQQQIELLHKEQQIRTIELQQEKQTTNLFIIAAAILGFLFVVLVVFSIQNRRIAKSLRKKQSELIDKNTSISEQKEKLDQLNKVKDRFFSIISHDLRNNLTTMKLYFDLVSNKDYEPQDTSEITRQISGSVENTIDLLENLLIWASAQIKGIPIHQQKLNVHTLSQENINLLSGVAHHKSIRLNNEVEEHSIAFADIDMINLVLRNLISNAIKFTPEHGTITIKTRLQDEKCIVSVQDNGVGISNENLTILFNQHEHPTTKGTANEKGTGLGLILCKDFVERNGGTIWVESEKDKGTTFFFSLPLHA